MCHFNVGVRGTLYASVDRRERSADFLAEIVRSCNSKNGVGVEFKKWKKWGRGRIYKFMKSVLEHPDINNATNRSNAR